MVIGAVTLALVYITLALWVSMVIELAASAGWAVLMWRGLRTDETSAILLVDDEVQSGDQPV